MRFSSRISNVFLSLTTAVSVCLICHPQAYTQTEGLNEEWRWIRFTTEDGLSSDRVYDVVETDSNTVWAATSAGLVWYDGLQWHTPEDSICAHARPSWISCGLKDTLLVVFNHQLYKGTTRSFKHISLISSGTGLQVVAAAPLNERDYMVLASGSMFVLRDGMLAPLPVPAPLDSSGKPNFFYTKGKGIWINTTAGLFRWNKSQWLSKTSASRGEPASPAYHLQNLVEDQRGNALASIHGPLESRGLLEWSSNAPPLRNTREGIDLIQTMDISPNGDAVAIYESGNIRIRHSGHWTSFNDVPPQMRNVLFLKYRDNGDTWIGTESGLFLHTRSSRRWTYWTYPFPNLKNTVHEILQARDGSVWLGTVQGIVIHRPGGRIDTIDQIDGKKIYIVTGLCEDNDGGIWISSGGMFEGSFRFHHSTWKYYGTSEGLDAGRIHKIHKDRKGRVWFLSLGSNTNPENAGAFIYSNGSFTRWNKATGKLYAFANAKDGTLWFGGLTGLFRWKEGVWTHWTAPKELRTKRIFALAVDHQNKLWFGDQVNGLGFIDKHDAVHYLTTADGLVNNEIWDIKVDEGGRLWIATRGGISCYANGIWSNFSRSSGLNNPKLWPILPAGDRLYAGTDGNGTNILDFAEASNPPPRVQMSTPIIEGNNVLLRWQAFAFWGELASREIQTRYRLDDQTWSQWIVQRELNLSAVRIGDHQFRVQAKGLFGSYDSTGGNVYFSIAPPFYLRPMFALPLTVLSIVVVFLGGMLIIRKRKHDHQLLESETRLRTVTETTASAIFILQDSHIQFVNHSAEELTGYSRDELLTKQFSDLIHPDHLMFVANQLPLWMKDSPSPHRSEFKIQTKDEGERWIDFAAGRIDYLGTQSILGTGFDITERKLAEDKLLAYQGKLQSLASELALTEERERRRMATYLHDSISQSLAFCQMKLAELRNVHSPEKLSSLLQDVNQLIEQSIENAQSLTFELSPPILYELSFKEALEWLVEKMGKQHNIHITLEDDGRATHIGDDIRVVLFHAVREIIVNIVKHAHTQSARLALRCNDGLLEIMIEDHGIGFDPSTIGSRSHRSGGFGLFNIRERLTHLGGQLTVESSQGKGTRVTLSATLQKATSTVEGGENER